MYKKNKTKIFEKFIILFFMISIFLLLQKQTSNEISLDKIKALNYNVSYKQAFPDEKLRHSILYCIVTNNCRTLKNQYIDRDIREDNDNGPDVITDSKITDAIKSKEKDPLNKHSLNNIVMLYIKDEENGKKIKNFTGIEYLPWLKLLYSNAVETSRIDVTSTTNRLIHLKLYGYDPTSSPCQINLHSTVRLTNLEFIIKTPTTRQNINSKLDLRNHNWLQNLTINYCDYKNIDIGNNTSLKTVDLNDNNLVEFISRRNTNLKYFDGSNNNFTNISFSNFPNLEYIDLSYNKGTVPFNFSYNKKAKHLNMEYSKVSSVDVKDMEALEELYVGGENLTTVIFNDTKNKNLKTFSMVNSKVSHSGIVNTSGTFPSKLLSLILENNTEFKELNIQNIPTLVALTIKNNPFTNQPNLDLKTLHRLEYVTIVNSKVESIKLGDNLYMQELNLSNNKLTEIDLDNINNLNLINLSNNKLASLNLSAKTRLEKINVSNNKLEELVLPNKTIECEKLNYSENKLTTVITANECLNVPQHIEIKVKEGKEFTLPIKYGSENGNYNYGELVENNAIFEKTGFQTYRMKKNGESKVNFNVFYRNNTEGITREKGNGGYVTITVIPSEATLFNPVVNTLTTKEGYEATFTQMDYKNAITNLPTNIKKFEVDINQLDTSTPGIKNITTKVTFSDDSIKNVIVPVNVEEVTKDNYNPLVTKITIKRKQTITDEQYKASITNLPNNIKRIDIVTRANSTQLGLQEAKVNVVLRNGQVKEVKIPVEIERIMADDFTPVFNTDIKYTDVDPNEIYSNNIVNLKTGITYKIFDESNRELSLTEVANIVSTKGFKKFKVKFKFSDESTSEFEMPLAIYEKKEKEIDLYSFIPTNEEYISYNNNKIFIKKNDLPENHCSSETYECYRYKRSEKTYNITEVTGNLNDILTDKYNTNIKFLNPSWTGNEERKVVDILEIDSEGQIKIVQTITILRDTDSDSIPDSIDEDDDNDQVSDTDEERDQTDPKDNTSYKVTKICYKVKS